jgi:hypothetical protein
MGIRSVEPGDRASLLAVAADGEFAPLRYLAMFGHDVAGQEQRDRAERILDAPGAHLVREVDAQVVGQASASPVPDLSEHFGLPFHEVGPLLTPLGADDRSTTVKELLDALVRDVADQAPGVVMLRLETDDLAGLLGAEEAGFRLRETTVTYVNDLERASRNPTVEMGDAVRLHRFGVDEPLPESTFTGIRGQASQVTQDHYHADPRLPDERCDALYERVLDRGLRGEGSDCIVMRIGDDGRLQGFGTWRHWSELDRYGVSMAGSSFGFRAPGAPAGFLHEVAAFVCATSITGNRLLEWSTQATNFPMVNMMCRQPSIRFCRSSYVLHRWTDGVWD